MAIKIVDTAEGLKEWLLNIIFNVPSAYDNRHVGNVYYNCGYCYYEVNGVKYVSWDCWNLFKTHAWGWTPGYNKGSFLYAPGKNGIEDWNGKQIMDRCSDVSTNFKSIVPGELLLTKAEDHMGGYIGEYVYAGKTYNVVECTPKTSVMTGGVVLSYVDTQGRRFNCKGGTQAGSWYYHGKAPWIDYTNGALTYTVKQSGNKQIVNVQGKGQLTIITTIK